MTRPVMFSKYSPQHVTQTLGLGIGAILGGSAGLGFMKGVRAIFGNKKNSLAPEMFMTLLGAAVGCSMGLKASKDIINEFQPKSPRPGM